MILTIFNGLYVMAPAALLDVPVRWTTLDEHSVRGEFSRGEQRSLSADGKTFRRLPWSTPTSDHGDVGGVRLPRRGDTVSKAPEGDFVYGELIMDETHYFPAGCTLPAAG